jgi:hypothetical protein
MDNTSKNDFFRDANQAQFNLLLDQLKQVDEWMASDFPEVDFKVKVDSHIDENTLTIEMTFLTAVEMSPNDRLFRKLELKFDEEKWNNVNTMVQIGHVADKYKQVISREINAWYAQRKEKDEHGVA